ncbi:NRDE family protein [Marinomonas balearica]|uniref:Transport and Golgi organization protein 2 n=1 Tax=Marinomonas balearica TaxID=491947 RepID=A0A4R6M442_9GAMM|nr:NRDE family protein [Marinomonas balearica]TDO95786.1 transport and Golgi organization protein 2 [Marinomonas balearica]
MCSVTWVTDKSGYQIFFNRDEQKTRAAALAPKQMTLKGVDVLMPIDPVGGGSWISTNEAGLSLCLLNNYQGQVPEGELTSRGHFLKLLSNSTGLEQIAARFRVLTMESFAPFTLLVFVYGQTQVTGFCWDGKTVSIKKMQSPHFSSGVDLGEVCAYRRSVYDAIESPDFDSLIDFHRHHHASESHRSVCMHREDAQSVSFTFVQVSAQEQLMSYVAGPPCEKLSKTAIERNSVMLTRYTSLVC